MTARVFNLHSTAKPKRSAFPPVSMPAWVLSHLKAANLLEDARFAWHSWPTLEIATIKFANLFGSQLRNQASNLVTFALVVKAIQSFKVARYNGVDLTTAAAGYVSELLAAGEIMATTRIEASTQSFDSEIATWDMSQNSYDDWVSSLPSGYTVSVHKTPAFPGEIKAGKQLVAALILTLTDYSCLVYPSPSATMGDM